MGDFNNDTRLDIVVVNNKNVSISLGHGNGSFQDQLTYITGTSPQGIAVGDFNNDSRSDIVVVNSYSNNVSVLLGYGNGSFQHHITCSTGILPWSVAVGDFNNDNQLDIVVGNVGDYRVSKNQNVSVLLGCKSEMFVIQTSLITGNNSQPRSFAVDDFNSDGYMDFIVANSGTHNIGVYLGYGNISFVNSTIYSTGSNSMPYHIALGDLNNDMYIDIVIANYNSDNIGIFSGCGNGSFTNYTTYFTGTNPSSIAVNDFDNDLILDIIVANHGSNNVVLFRGFRNGMFEKMVLIQLAYGSSPVFVLVADFNNDRKLDFIIADDSTDSSQVFLQTC